MGQSLLTVALSKIHKQNLKKIFFNELLESVDKIKKKNIIEINFYFHKNYGRRVRKSTNKKFLD